ncbi:hypothetical protein [Caldicellulosiruptor kronotskyensis]|uniref:hypothetical protein n=1 Tax=Caldicellulosiruptor kronotskyensis TaxID=413889 RepID=UPI000304A04C|nr:hypothetical protein [Caldicellulosiruptor kronotskyensis]
MDDRIKEVNVVNDSLEITLTSGLKLYVLITENSSIETMVRGSGSFQQIDLKPESDCKIIDFNYDFTLSKDILLWAPFDTK